MAEESSVRQNFHADCEAGVNKQINLELYASYVYMSMAYYFDRDDVALKGFHKYFLNQSNEEHKHAQKLMKFQNDRGGRIKLQDVAKPEQDAWGTALQAMEAALALEKMNNQSLLELHRTAAQHNDAHMCDFLEDHYLKEQVESIKEIGDHITGLKRAGPNLGEYMYDRETIGED